MKGTILMRNRSLWLGVLILSMVVMSSPNAKALYLRPDLEKIPVDRLIENLEMMTAREPKNVPMRYNLARAYGMAYASKAENFDVWKGKMGQGPWFGYEPAHVPFNKVKEATTDEQLKKAKEYLAKAVATYEAVLKKEPNFLPAQLGLAWCTEQTGNKEAAINAYRKVIENSWKEEKNLKAGRLGARYITSEAVGYLTPLLDPIKDSQEIQTLQEHATYLMRLPRPITPLAIPLEDNLSAQDLENHSAKVTFDADGSGLPRQWTWITPKAAWLVYDPQEKGEICSALQMFGNVGFWLFWEHGYQALSALDDNHDGILSGKELTGLALWHDRNGNGRCDPGEVRPLSAYGIVSLSCQCQVDTSHPDRIVYSPRGVIFADGRTRPSFDIILQPR